MKIVVLECNTALLQMSIISFSKGGNECMTQQNDHGRQHAIALLLPLVSNYCTNLYLKAIGSVIV